MDNIELMTISHIASCGNYVMKYYYDGRPRKMIRTTLKEVEAKYCVASLVRIHKQLIINLNHISSYTVVNGKHFVEINGTESQLKVSRSYLSSFIKRYKASQAPVVYTRNDPGYLFL